MPIEIKPYSLLLGSVSFTSKMRTRDFAVSLQPAFIPEVRTDQFSPLAPVRGEDWSVFTSERKN